MTVLIDITDTSSSSTIVIARSSENHSLLPWMKKPMRCRCREGKAAVIALLFRGVAKDAELFKRTNPLPESGEFYCGALV